MSTAEGQSSKTLEALAQVIRALAPEVCGLSFHDFAADTLWLSDDFMLPEDHRLVEDSLSGSAQGGSEMIYGVRDAERYAVAIAVRDSFGGVNGALRLSIDSLMADAWTAEPLEKRLAPVLVCLAAEFERRAARLRLPGVTQVQAASIESALRAECFELFLQPICALRDTHGQAHYEVLLRLRTADGQLLEPGAFLRTAAHRQLMPGIDRWVVRSLLGWLVSNRKLSTQPPSKFCINLSSQSVTDARFLSYVEACVINSGVPREALCFEITERFASSGNISVAESMQRLEALGCEVALDDFGAYATNYGYLRSVPAHYFKIDGSLVEAAPTDRVARAVISSIVRMAGDLGVQTVAESVESDTELNAVRALGVDYAQGFLLGRPSSLLGYDFAAQAANESAGRFRTVAH